MIDPVTVLRTITLANAGVTAQIGTRLWGEYIPANEITAMPRKAIRLIVDPGMPESQIPALNVIGRYHCFGATIIEAWEVARVLYDALVRKGSTTVVIGATRVLYYMSNCEQWGSYVPEPDTGWPRIVASYSFALSEAYL